MNDLLPSYESVMDRNPWKFTAEYLPVQDLCSAVVVCRKWHTTFTPWLWGNPASHFRAQDDTVYAALTKFKEILPCARLTVRELTHTLHLPPAHAEAYGGPHAEWLRACLEHLPRLQCLLVDGLPFFDHASLLHLRYPSLQCKLNRVNAYPVFGLRLLDATACANATSTGLTEALPHFPDLLSLDLSRTPAARDDVVLGNLKFLQHLRVLGLNGLRLDDGDFSIISRSIGTRVRSLDVSDNNLTDISARLLLRYCMKEVIIWPHLCQNSLAFADTNHANGDAKVLGFRTRVIQLRRKLTYGFAGSLATEEARDIGITHLYITKNDITIKGASELLSSGCLEALDIGELSVNMESGLDGDIPSTSHLTPTLSEYGSARLHYLRIDYRVVTEDASAEPCLVPQAKLGKKPSRCLSTVANQLVVAEPLASDCHAVGRAVFESPTVSVDPTKPCRKSAPNSIQRTSGLHRNIGLSPIVETPESSQDMLSSIHPATRSRRNSTHLTQDQRARLDFRQSQENRLHPGALPRVHTLVLTKVPTVTKSKDMVGRMIQYIKDAAEEASIARQRARHTYRLPPGRSRGIAEREYAHSLFALRRIVLEMAPPETAQKQASTSWRASSTNSSTGDQDSEAFWEAARHDFSFFRDEEGAMARDVPSACEVAPFLAVEPLLDVIAELCAFRKAQRAAREAAEEGWWPGVITVVRKTQLGPE